MWVTDVPVIDRLLMPEDPEVVELQEQIAQMERDAADHECYVVGCDNCDELNDQLEDMRSWLAKAPA